MLKELSIGWKRVAGGEFMADNSGGAFLSGVGGDSSAGLSQASLAEVSWLRGRRISAIS